MKPDDPATTMTGEPHESPSSQAALSIPSTTLALLATGLLRVLAQQAGQARTANDQDRPPDQED
jgi:hypothetical protein